MTPDHDFIIDSIPGQKNVVVAAGFSGLLQISTINHYHNIYRTEFGSRAYMYFLIYVTGYIHVSHLIDPYMESKLQIPGFLM